MSEEEQSQYEGKALGPLPRMDIAGHNGYGFVDLKAGIQVAFFRERSVCGWQNGEQDFFKGGMYHT